MDAIDAMDESGLLSELKDAVEALSEGLALFDAEDRLVIFNTRFAEMNREMRDLLAPGLSWGVFLAEAARQGAGEGLEELDAHLSGPFEEPFSTETERSGGRIIRSTIQSSASGGFILTENDVTEARQASAVRSEAQDMLGRFVEASPVCLSIYDLERERFIQWTPAWEEQFGHPTTTNELWADPADRADYLAEILSRHRVDDFEARLKRADGTIFPARIYARLIEYNGSRLTIGSAVDMTQLYAQRDELARQREASYQTEKLTALGELLAGVAHELNNPLSVVVGQALMLREEIEEPSFARRIEKISTSAERCSKIVKTFLAMARQRPVALVPVSLNAIVETALDVAAYGLRSAGAIIETDLADDLPDVLADEDQIAQVFVNLIVNAEQALADKGADGRVAIKTWLDPKSGQVMASVADNGPGVPPSMRARIFEPFFTTKGVGEGTGVGLALCHRIVGTHDGSLELTESADGGACFTVTLPSAPATGVAVSPPQAAALAPGLTALVVDDEDDFAEVIGEILRDMGVKATLASSAENGLAAIENGQRFDIILSDLKMPGIGGSGLFDALRRRSPGMARRVAFITGDTISPEAEMIRRESGRPMLAKPVTPQELRAVVSELVGAE